jgi:hypothetical protein
MATCSCGHEFYSKEYSAGKHVQCPVCGLSVKRRVQWGGVMAALLFLLPGVLFACLMAFDLQARQSGVASQTWPTTQGVVVEHEQTVRRDGGKFGAIRFYLLVKYNYNVGGVVYVNNRRSFHFGSVDGFPDNKEGRREVKERYPRNARCTVYYNPHDPAESCLEPGPASRASLAIFGTVSALFMSLAIFVLVKAIRGTFRPREEEGGRKKGTSTNSPKQPFLPARNDSQGK